MRKALKTHEGYKDSGFKWLGKIPHHWKVKKFNYIADIVEGQVDPKQEAYQDYILVAPNHIESGTGRLLFQETALEQGAISGKYLFQSGDVIYSKIRPALRKVWKAEFPGICSADMYPIRLLKKTINPAYFTFLCLSESFSGFMIATSMRVAMPKVNRDDFHECHFIIPPITEQEEIAHYLDIKTAQIDRKIDLLTQKAQRYEELKRSLINETVTRGLDKSVSMKDSGIEWIGEIPEHWQIERISMAFEERKERVNDTDYPPLSVTMQGVVPQLDNAAKTDNNDNRKRVAINDFVINSRSDRRGSSGISELNGSVSVINIVLTPKRNFHVKYLHHLFKSYRFTEEFYRSGRGIVDDLWTTKYSVMKTISFAFPNIVEQKVIAHYLDTKTAQIDQIIQTINTQIEKLKELRKTLINDVVTGKIKVIN